MKKFKRRSFGSASRLEQNEECPPLDLSKEPHENMKDLLTEITKKESMATSKRMGFLNNFSQLIRVTPPEKGFGFSLQEIIVCLKVPLVSPAKEVRAAALRACRHLVKDEKSLLAVVEQRIDLFAARALDLMPAFEVERVQALRLARKIMYTHPRLFPKTLGMALTSISTDSSQDKDRMARACLATLCELAVLNASVAASSGAINAIISNVLDCSIPRMNESLVLAILYMFNHPDYRIYVRRDVCLEAVLAPFTDLYYRHSADIPDNLLKEDHQQRMDAGKTALVTMFRSWAGIVALCNPEGSGIMSLLGVFTLPAPSIRLAIMESLFDIFCLRIPEWTNDFAQALSSVDPSTMQSAWELSNGFVVLEANEILPHKAKTTRINLIDSYLAVILYVFIEAGVLESLVEVITTSEDEVFIRATILLGELLHMANSLLPPGCGVHTHCLPTLMSFATNPELSSAKRGKASVAVGYLNQLHQMKKRGTVPCSLFLIHLVTQAASHNEGRTKSNKDKHDVLQIKDADELLYTIRDTQVLILNDFLTMWDWDLISTVLDSSRLSLKRVDDPTYAKFIRRLLHLFKPSSKQFCVVPVDHVHGKKLAEIGLQLIDFLLRKDEQTEGEKLLHELMIEVRDALGEATSTGTVTGVFSTSSITDTLSQYYFLFIGKLSSSTMGTRVLEKTAGVFQYSLEICNMSTRESAAKLLVCTFDYGRDGIARVLLSKVLTSPSLSCRFYGTRFLRVLLRAKAPYFSNWGMELLTNQLYDQDKEIVNEAITILEEACEDETNLQRLVEIRPSLLHLGDKGMRLLIRFLSISRGFSYLSDMEYIDVLLQRWQHTYNAEYVRWVEGGLAEALTSFERISQDGSYIRRSNERSFNRNVFVAPHLYGELAQHRSGIALLEEKGIINDLMSVITHSDLSTIDSILSLKAALWGLGHIGSTQWGIAQILPRCRVSVVDEAQQISTVLDDVDIVREIVRLSSDSEVFSIRGTCIYVLCLIAKTSQGADTLEDLNWECVRHKGGTQWPVIEQEMGPYLPVDFNSDDDDNEDETDEGEDGNAGGAASSSFNADRFGGVYLGDDDVNEEPNIYQSKAFEYTRITFNEETRRRKGGKRTPQEENEKQEKDALVTDFTSRVLDIDDEGRLREGGSVSLTAGLERLVNSDFSFSMGGESYDGNMSGFLGTSMNSTFSNGDVKMHHSNTEPNISSLGNTFKFDHLPNEDNSYAAKTKPTREIFDRAGIYLGEEELSDDDTEFSANDSTIGTSIESNTSSLFLEQPRMLDSMRGDSEALVPIREVESSESLIRKSSGEPTLATSFENRRTASIISDGSDFESSKQVTRRNTCASINSDIERLHVSGDESRFRSVSLTENGETAAYAHENRSASFSGTSFHGNLMDGRSSRLDSSTTIGSQTSSYSSQESDSGQSEIRIVSNHNNKSRVHSNSDVARNRFNSQTKILQQRMRNNSDRDRSCSFEHEAGSSTSPVRQKKLRRAYFKGSGSTLSPSPRGAYCTTTEPTFNLNDSFTSSRDAYGYTVWSTLQKQRAFKKEMETKLRRITSSYHGHGSRGHQRRRRTRNKSSSSSNSGRGTTRDYDMNSVGVVDRRGSSPAVLSHPGHRRQFSVASSISNLSTVVETMSPGGSSPATATTDTSGAITENYVGRCLPCDMLEILAVKPYKFEGSPADYCKQMMIVKEESARRNTNGGDDTPNSTDTFLHDQPSCLACMNIPKRENDPAAINTDHRLDHTKHLSTSTSKADTITQANQDLSPVQKEVIRLTVNLSSAVASKSSQQALLLLRERYPSAFQDLCLYSQVMDQLGNFRFQLSIRRFIEAQFDTVNFLPVFQQADYILGRTTKEK